MSLLLPLALCAIVIVTESSGGDTDTARDFLSRYGYLNDTVTHSFASVEAQRSLQHAIALFQEYYGLPGKGELNNATLRLMRRPRCGVPDIPNHATGQNILFKWPKTHLTWNFHLATPEILTTTRAAFDKWAEKSALTFERDSSNPDIVLSFALDRHFNVERRKNGAVCLSNFDGQGGVIGHSNLPIGIPDQTSEVHLDAAEPWHVSLNENPPDMEYLFQTLTHEIGHALGLLHSENKNSIIYAFAVNMPYPLELSEEDVLRIQQLYGFKGVRNDPPATTSRPGTTPRPVETDLCALHRIDSILVLNERIFVAHGRHVWSIDIEGKTYNKPVSLDHYLKFLPRNFTRLSAAYQAPSGDFMLFANKMVYRVAYPSYELLPNWPISQADFGLPPDARVDAAVNTNRGRSFVLYGNGRVGEIDECRMRIIRHHTVQAIFPGIPQGVTSAFRYIDGNLYFVSRRQFYRFNEFTRGVTAAGKMDLQIVGVVCPRDGLLEQIRSLLSRLVRIDSALAYTREEEKEEEEEEDYS